MEALGALLGVTFVGMGLVVFVIIAFTIFAIVFNILMIVDCVQRDFKDQTVWLVLLILGFFMGFGLIVAILYYLMVKREADQNGL